MMVDEVLIHKEDVITNMIIACPERNFADNEAEEIAELFMLELGSLGGEYLQVLLAEWVKNLDSKDVKWLRKKRTEQEDEYNIADNIKAMDADSKAIFWAVYRRIIKGEIPGNACILNDGDRRKIYKLKLAISKPDPSNPKQTISATAEFGCNKEGVLSYESKWDNKVSRGFDEVKASLLRDKVLLTK